VNALRRLSLALFRIALGLTLGLVIAEVVFRFRDDGAFPHVNVYVSDEKLGARLEPGASQRLAFAGNPTTSLRINSKGFRGGEWPAPKPGELVVVGDSQVFGLGVEEDETFPAQLAKQSGRQVLNAGIPTYGPREYLAVAKQLVTERPGANVVLVFNVSNDFFELDRPNVLRHAVWDGWAVRKENKPSVVSHFPGRQWLFSKSHLVFAVRKLQLERQRVRGNSETLVNFGPEKNSDADELDEGTASEGSWTDLLTAHEREERRLAGEADRARREQEALSQRIGPVRERIEQELEAVAQLEGRNDPFGGMGAFQYDPDEVLRKQPGDIVRKRYVESSRSIVVTAEMLVAAAQEKQRLVELRARLERQRAPHEQVLRRDYAELEAIRWSIPRPESELPKLGDDFLDELAAFQETFQKTNGEVTVVVLPLDVQVSKAEWAKYGAPEKDLTDTLELNRSFTAAAQRRGLRAVDVVEPLQKAEPGAFLLGDLHMTTKGIGAVASFVAEALKKPAPVGNVPSAWPEGVTLLPSPAEWNAVGENTVKGSTAAGCETKQVREWLRVRCKDPKNEGAYFEVALLEGHPGEVQLTSWNRGASAIVPVRRGERTRVVFRFEKDTGRFDRVLRVDWTAGQAVLEFEKSAVALDLPNVSTTAGRAFADCNEKFSGADAVPWGDLSPDSACLKYPDCERRLACAQGHPNAKPACDDGEVNAGADFRCLRVCVDDVSCDGAFGRGTKGTCRVWQSVRVCY
jgi:hypothetical protein